MEQFDIVVITLRHQPRGTTDPYEDVEFHFAQPYAGLVAGFQPRRIIDSLSEVTAEIKPTEGLGSRASFSMTLADSTSDPYANDGDRVVNTGTFFSMMMAKNRRGCVMIIAMNMIVRIPPSRHRRRRRLPIRMLYGCRVWCFWRRMRIIQVRRLVSLLRI